MELILGKVMWIIDNSAPQYEKYKKQHIEIDQYMFDHQIKDGKRIIWGFDTETERDAKYVELVTNQVVITKADKGQLMDDIAVWHNVFSETLIKILIFKYSTEPAQRVRLKVISDVIGKYNLDLVIKDFKPDYVIPERDKEKLIDGLKEVEKYDDGIYQRLAMAVGLESNALHNEVIDAYERVIQTIHPIQQIDGNTLAGELPVNAGGTQT